MRKNYFFPLFQAGILLTLSTLSDTDTYARYLEPEEALSILASGRMKSASTAPLKLTYTQEMNAQPTVYVFDRENEPGFYLLAADDAIGNIVLGYSDTNYFSADNIAPGLQWLLNAYSKCVSECADGFVITLSQAPKDWGRIEPLITTKWDQDAPYNDMCPVLSGSRTVTGCVATAAAQIMKKFQWPVSGKGSHSYQSKYTINGTKPTFSSDFSSHKYDWVNMLDSYDATSTQVQKDAVAQLMKDCGIAAETQYAPQGSSASMIKEGAGMLEYFDYDKSMNYVKREWFSNDEWKLMMYDEISQGRPVFYSGDNYNSAGEKEGHAFVLDGYDGEGYFHFNWGWGGYGDTYCSLDYLVPEITGIGGGQGNYSLHQEALVSIKPNANDGAQLAVEFAIVGEFKAELIYDNAYKQYIVRFFTDADSPTNNKGFINYTLAPVEIEIGFKTTLKGDVLAFSADMLNPGSGYSEASCGVNSLPIGEYDIYPVYRTSGGEWIPMRHSLTTSGRLHFISDGKTIQIQTVEVPDGIADVVSEKIRVHPFGGCIHVDAPTGTKVAVYDVTGMLCYSGADHVIPVEKNRIYIVVVGEKVFKVKG